MARWHHHLHARGNHSHARPTSTAPPCGQRSDARRPPTRSSGAKGRRSSWCLAARSEGASTATRSSWCETWSDCGPTERRQPCAPPRLPAGRVAGGACCRSAAGLQQVIASTALYCPWAAMAPTATGHQRCGSAGRPRSRARRGRGAEPPATATPVVVVGTGHKVGRSKRALVEGLLSGPLGSMPSLDCRI